MMSMNIKDLKFKLEQMSTPISWYHLELYGNYDQRITMKNEEGKWIVFYSERGERFKVKEFATETEACEDLLTRINDRFDFQKNFIKP